MGEEVKVTVTRTNRFGVTLPVGVVVETNAEDGVRGVSPLQVFDSFFGGSLSRQVQTITESNVGVQLTLQVPKSKAKATAEVLRAMAQELEDF